MTAYYNEIDPFAAAWLRNLISAGHIAPGDVDERSIEDVTPADLAGYTQCHFFAGIGVWSHALRRAGWLDDRPVWTGSCPCQPFSAAGKGLGTGDERHLWPVWFELIRACKPPVIFGEQVASAQIVGHKRKGPRIPNGVSPSQSGQGFDPSRQVEGSEEGGLFRSGPVGRRDPNAGGSGRLRGHGQAIQSGRWQDLGQSVTGSDQPERRIHPSEHSGGLPWSEQRDGGLGGAETYRDGTGDIGEAQAAIERIIRAARPSSDGEDAEPWLDAVFADLEQADYACGSSVLPACGVGAPHIRQRLWFVGKRLEHATDDGRHEWRAEPGEAGDEPGTLERPERLRDVERLADADSRERDRIADGEGCIANGAPTGWQQGHGEPECGGATDRPGPTNGFWRDADWLYCRDGKWRPVEPGTFPLANGVAGRVGRLRAYGNAINAEAAETFIRCVTDV